MAGIQDAKNSLKEKAAAQDAEELMEELEEALGKSLDEMNDREVAVAGTVASKLSKSGNTQADQLCKQLASRMVTDGNDYLFPQVSGNKTTEYIDLGVISNITSFRYFYDDSKAIATMTSGSTVYIFRRGSDQMNKQSMSSEPETLKQKTVYQKNIYLFEDDADNYFGCKTEYISGTDYAICL